MLTLAGESNAPARAKAILDFETKIARAHWTQVESRDATKTYNKMTIAELQRRAPGFNFRAYLDGVGAKGDQLIVYQPSAFTGIAKAIQAAPLQVLKDQLLVRSLSGYGAVLPKEIDDTVFGFYGTTLSGTPQQEERWKRGVTFTSGALADDTQQDLRPAALPAGDQGRRRRAREERRCSHGTPDRPADLDAAGRPRRAPRPSSPTSRRRSAIRISGATIRASTSVPATRSAMPCARPSSSTSISTASSAARSASGSGS